MKVIKFRWSGISPLMMQSGALVDPLHPVARELKKVNSKKSNKTEADHEAVAFMEFGANLYFDAAAGPYLPAANIDGCIRDGAKKRLNGKKVEAGFTTIDDVVPLLFDGPREIAAIYADKRFVDRRAVKVKNVKVMRTRPIFRQWRVEFEAAYDEDLVDFDELKDAAAAAGKYVGIGTFRPRFGRFSSEVLDHG